MLVGIAMVFFSLWYLSYSRRILSFNATPDKVTKIVRSSPPWQIKIANAKIDLSLEAGKIENGIWQISPDKGSYLVTGAFPGEGGNIVIYGHNKWGIFGKLNNVKKGQKVILINKDGKEYEYTVDKILVVDPTNTSFVEPKDYEVLTIYTCTGFLDSKRLVVQAMIN